LLLHPDNEHIIYPLGSTVVVRHILSRTQTFLRGHNHKISCKQPHHIAIKISRDGKHIASAEHSFPGQVAEVLVWDFEKREIKHRFKLHKNSVTSLAFSPDSRLLASQGCLEDKYSKVDSETCW
jgi:WD40 repeat protein